MNSVRECKNRSFVGAQTRTRQAACGLAGTIIGIDYRKEKLGYFAEDKLGSRLLRRGHGNTTHAFATFLHQNIKTPRA